MAKSNDKVHEYRMSGAAWLLEIINRYSNPGDVVYDPFGGLMTVPMMAVKMHRFGKGCELNPDYFRDGVGYLQSEENEVDSPTLFDFLEVGDE